MIAPEPKQTEELARTAIARLQEALEPLLARYSLAVVELKREGPYPAITVKNKYTFIRCTWSPQDGYGYDLGSVRLGWVPVNVFRRPWKGARQYGLHWILKLRKDVLPQRILDMGARGRKSAIDGITALEAASQSLLQGDWSCRRDLDKLIKANR